MRKLLALLCLLALLPLQADALTGSQRALLLFGKSASSISASHSISQFSNLSLTDKTVGMTVTTSGQAAIGDASDEQVRGADFSAGAGTTYFEAALLVYGTPGSQNMRVGIANAAHSFTNNPGLDNDSWSFVIGNGGTDFRLNSVVTNVSTGTVAQGDIVAIKIDWGNKLAYFKNITQGGGYNPVLSGAGVSFATMNAGPYKTLLQTRSAGDTIRINTGLLSYAGTPDGANWLPSISANYTANQIARIVRVKGLFAAASYPSVMLSPPTINNLPTGNASNIPSAVFVSINDTSHVNPYGVSNFGIAQNAALNDGINRNYYDGSSVFYPGSSATISASFNHTGQQLDFVFGGSSTWQLLVNGQLISATQQSKTVTGGTRFVQQVIFSGSATRQITIISQESIAGFFVGPSDVIVPSDPALGTLAMGFQGDSYAQQTGSNIFYALAYESAFALGGVLTWNDPVGGTGFIAENAGVNGGVNNNFTERLGIMTPASPIPDVFVTMGGINDSSALTAANVSAHVAKLRSMFPDTVLIYYGPWCPQGSQATAEGNKYASIRDVIKQAINADTGPWIFVDNLLGQWYNSAGKTGQLIVPALQGPVGWTGGVWQTGNGHVGATTGTGNGDTWVQSDGTHPTPTAVDGAAIPPLGLVKLTSSAVKLATAAF